MSRNRVRAAALSVAMIAAVGLTVGITETSVSATQKTEITESHPSHPISGEDFYIRGTIASHIQRPVELQRRFHDTWKLVGTSETNSAGQFQIQTSTTVDRTFRVVAHTYTPDTPGAITYKLRKTAGVPVTLANDTVKVTASPSEVRRNHPATFTFTFGATRVGRSLIQESIVNGVRQPNSDGITETGRVMTQSSIVPANTPTGTWEVRVIAESWHGSATAKSSWVTFKVK
jgi:hypothetical protein